MRYLCEEGEPVTPIHQSESRLHSYRLKNDSWRLNVPQNASQEVKTKRYLVLLSIKHVNRTLASCLSCTPRAREQTTCSCWRSFRPQLLYFTVCLPTLCQITVMLIVKDTRNECKGSKKHGKKRVECDCQTLKKIRQL